MPFFCAAAAIFSGLSAAPMTSRAFSVRDAASSSVFAMALLPGMMLTTMRT